MNATTTEITTNVKNWLTRHGYTIASAAQKMGMSAGSLGNTLNGRPIGRIIAHRMHEAFGFDLEYLLAGIGTLLPEEERPSCFHAPSPQPSQEDDVVVPRGVARIYENMSETIRSQQDSIRQLTALVQQLATPGATAEKKDAPSLRDLYTMPR